MFNMSIWKINFNPTWLKQLKVCLKMIYSQSTEIASKKQWATHTSF